MARELDRLVAWEAAGGTWRVERYYEARVVLALLTCDGGEVMDVLDSDDPCLAAYVGARRTPSRIP